MVRWAVIILGIIAILVIRFCKKWKQGRQLRQRQQRAATLLQDNPDLATETIFVSLVCHNVRTCAHAIISMFDKAVSPGRVFVGVCHVLDKDNTDSVSYNLQTELESASNDTAQTGWPLVQEHTRLCTLTRQDTTGDLSTRAYLEQHVYRGEKYYYSADDQTLMKDDWDRSAVDQLLQCDSAYPVLAWCSSPDDKPEFLVATGSGLQFTTRGMAGNVSSCLPSMFCSGSHCFTLGERVTDVPTPQKYYYPNWSEEVVDASIRLWTSGWDFFCPTTPLCYTKTARVDGHGHNELTHVQTGRFRSLNQYQAYCGVDFRQGLASGRAKLGVSDQAGPAEIISKYGSMTAFHYNKALATA